MNFQFNNVTKKIPLWKIQELEEKFFVLQGYNERPEEELFKDMLDNRWYKICFYQKPN
jgi:hypothetical protein